MDVKGQSIFHNNLHKAKFVLLRAFAQPRDFDKYIQSTKSVQQSSLGKLTQLRTKHFPACISIASQREAIQGQFDDTDGIWSLWQYAHSLFDIARGHNKVNWNPKRDKLCSLVRQEFEPCVSGSILQQNANAHWAACVQDRIVTTWTGHWTAFCFILSVYGHRTTQIKQK